MKLEQARDLLPPTVQRIAEVVGLPATMKLVAELGGTSWFFAQGVGRNGQARVAALAEIVGEEAAEKLGRYASERERIYIAKCDAALIALRDAEIHSQFEQATREGVSANTIVNELARTYQLSDRHVWRILKRLPELAAPSTPDLFN